MKGDINNLWARPLHYERFYREMQQMIHELVPGRVIKLAVNEWNTALPLPAQQSMTSAIYGARLMNVFERTGDLVGMSAVSDLVNGWSGGIIQASRHAVFVTPTYLVNALYASHLGQERLASTLRGPTFDSTLEGRAIPAIDAVASRSSNRRQIFIKLVNTDPVRAMPTQILLPGVRFAKEARMETLNGDDLKVSNDFSHPDAVRVSTSTINDQPVVQRHASSTLRLDHHHPGSSIRKSKLILKSL